MTAQAGYVATVRCGEGGLAELAEALAQACRQRPPATVLLLTHGTSLSPDGDPDAAAAAGRSVRRTLARTGVPSILSVAGPVTGAGLAPLLDVDLVVCHPGTEIAAGDPAQLLAAGVAGPLLRRVGAGRAHALLLTGVRWDAPTAQRCGLVTEITDDPQSRAGALADTLAGNPAAGLLRRAVAAAHELAPAESATYDRDLRDLLP